jgi:hypothetical protein
MSVRFTDVPKKTKKKKDKKQSQADTGLHGCSKFCMRKETSTGGMWEKKQLRIM